MTDPNDQPEFPDLDQTADSARPPSGNPSVPKSDLDIAMAAAFEQSDSTMQHVSRSVESAGMIIAGKYKLIQQIGEGGMGSVWLAEQREPVKRNVALKLIKSGMDSKSVLARFEAERQALALMDHPNIARIFDGGLTESGAPYFAMELVKGVPITQFCDAQRLTPRQRLELFMPVCQAIQHAHQKGIIHRDIKPSNVMVAMYDDKPVSKVIDFGLAKATGQSLTDQTLNTGFNVVGTPQYMSPEQASLNQLDIDTRSDIYSLGVLLYELLAGSPPFTSKELEKAAFLEILRVIREEEPPRPSTKLSSSEGLPSISACRGTEPKKLTGLLRNELDWIVMKSLEKDRRRRYETANGFAADIQRYLAGEAVLAHPPSRTYRLQKFLRKNKGPVIAASLVAFALVAGMVGTSYGLFHANENAKLARLESNKARDAEQVALNEKAAAVIARNEAVAAANAEKLAREAEAAQRKYAESIADFVKNDFLALTSAEGQDRFDDFQSHHLSTNSTLRELLDRAAMKLNSRQDLDPKTEAELRQMIGINYRELGEFDEAIQFLSRSLELTSGLVGERHIDTVDIRNSLACAYLFSGNYQPGTTLLEKNLDILGKQETASPIKLVACLSNLSGAYIETGDFERTLPFVQDGIRIARCVLGETNPDSIVFLSRLSSYYSRKGDWDRARAELEHCLALADQVFEKDDTRRLAIANSLVECYFRLEEHAKGVKLADQTVEQSARRYGDSHPVTISSLNALGLCYMSTGRVPEALDLFEKNLKRLADLDGIESLKFETLNWIAKAELESKGGRLDRALTIFEQVLEYYRNTSTTESLVALVVMNDMAAIYSRQGNYERSLELNLETLELLRSQFGDNHPQTTTTLFNTAMAYRQLGNAQQALPMLEESVKSLTEVFGENQPITLTALTNLAECFRAVGQLDRALPLFKKALKLTTASLGSDHPDTLRNMVYLSQTYRAVGQVDHALSLSESLLQTMTVKLGADHPETLTAMNSLARCYSATGQWDKAIPLLEHTLELMNAILGPDHINTLNTLGVLGSTYRDAGQMAKGLDLLERTLELKTKALGPNHPDTLRGMLDLAEGFRVSGQSKKALSLIEKTLKLMSEVNGEDHPDTLSAMHILAVTYGLLEQLDQAIPLLEKCLTERTRKLGPSHPDTLKTIGFLGRFYRQVNRYDDAIRLLEESATPIARVPTMDWVHGELRLLYGLGGREDQFAKMVAEDIALARSTYGPASEGLASALECVASDYLSLKKYELAEQLLRECLTVREKVAPDSWALFESRSMLGEALSELQKVDEATPLLESGYEGLKEHASDIPEPVRRERLIQAIDRLIELAKDTGNPESLNKWARERTTWHPVEPTGEK